MPKPTLPKQKSLMCCLIGLAWLRAVAASLGAGDPDQSMVLYYLKSRDLRKIEGREFTLRIQKNSQDSVRFSNETQIPLRYRMVAARIDGELWERLMESVSEELKPSLMASIQDASPSNEAIKQAVQNQIAVPGAEVYRGDHLRIA